jgi:D-alanyl-D-alanine carboxypeptidase (penicillin-binding protein 5/6)
MPAGLAWCLLSILLAIGSVGARAQTIQTSVPHAILIDFDTRTILFEKSPDELVTPASTAKVMTAELVFRELAEGRLKLDDEFLVSENAWRSGGALARGSTMFAALNSKIRVEDLIRGLVVLSGNDAAIVLAENLAGSEGAFATRMTKRARELGLEKSVFTNAWGRGDPEQKVTAREMAFLAEHVIRTYPDYYKYFGEKEFTWNKIKQSNRNPLLALDVGADGLKTGNVDDSGYGLIGSAQQNGQRLIIALYGAKTAKERADEARKLIQWGFRTFDAKTLFQANEPVGRAKVYGGTQGHVDLVAGRPVKLLIPRTNAEKLTGRIVYQGPLAAPVEEGKEVARLKIFRGTSEVLDMPLKTAAAIEPGSLSQRAMDAGLELAGGLIRKYVSRK